MKFSPRLKIGVIVILIIALFLVLNLTPLGKEIRNVFHLISLPIQKTFWTTGKEISGFFESIIQSYGLKQDNEELELKIQELLVENFALKELKKENEILREALKIGLEKEFELTLVRVTGIIGKGIYQDFISIDKGSQDGIRENFPVITEEKILIGKVIQVYENFSNVLLISHPESSFIGKIFAARQTEASGAEANSEILGVVKGKGNLRISFERVPRETEIKKGDLLVTSALGGIFPTGLLVGEVSEVVKSDLEPYQRAEIQPAFNLRDLEKLFIINLLLPDKEENLNNPDD